MPRDVHQAFEDQLHAHAKRIIPPGSFIVPLDVAFALGNGDGGIGEDIIAKMFAGGRYTEAMPRVLPPEVVREIGHGNIANGRRVLEKFVTDLRARQETGTAKEVERPQPRARGGRVGKMSKEAANYRDAANDEFCARCKMHQPRTNSCTLVAGPVHRVGLCDYFEQS
jgi:hypothetical protein